MGHFSDFLAIFLEISHATYFDISSIKRLIIIKHKMLLHFNKACYHCTCMCFHSSYLNNTYIKKQKYSDADMQYGVFPVDADCLLEIGEVSCM